MKNEINYYLCVKYLFPLIRDKEFYIVDREDGKGTLIEVWKYPSAKPSIKDLEGVWEKADVHFKLKEIAKEVVARLIASDWTHLGDHPLAPEKQKEWKDYRAKLRSFVDECDPHNPIWPEQPSEENKNTKKLKEGKAAK